jgi:hypothetical protein
MKKSALIPAVLSLMMGFFLADCRNLIMDKPVMTPLAGQGVLLVSLSGTSVQPSLGGTNGQPSLNGGALTMLPLDPEFTRYELVFASNLGAPLGPAETGYRDPYVFYNSTVQLPLPVGTYYILARGYNGDAVVAKSDVVTVTVSVAGSVATAAFTLAPYIDTNIPGALNYALSWDGLSRMPSRAELLIESYENGPIPLSSIPQNLTPGPSPGTILLLSRDSALVQLTGSLSLSPGEYRLTMTLTMDPGTRPVSRMDMAHVYSNLTTAGAFYYGGGDLLVSNASPDSGAAFITKFTFTETPHATTVIGGVPGTDGRRLIMVMVPSKKANNDPIDLAKLTPVVECAPGSVITSPAPRPGVQPYGQGEIDFTNPTLWTAQAKDGAVQQYTVVVSKAPDNSPDKRITYFFFEGYADSPGIIDEGNKTIRVVLPHTTTAISSLTLSPVISIIGEKVWWIDGGSAEQPITSYNSVTPTKFRVYAANGTSQDYAVTVEVAGDGEAQITQFVVDGYPDADIRINETAGTITGELPYGVSLVNLTPLIQYRGKTLSPVSGAVQNFGVPVYYTVTAESGVKKTYTVTLGNKPANSDTGIFDFVITNVSAAKVVIGQKARSDGKIPIVIQVPYGTDEKNLIPAITLRSPASSISPGSGIKIPFGNAGNNQEAVYTVTAQGGASQQYVAVVSEDTQYYYVNGLTGRDDWPDVYNGGSESHPFKTLAYAVSKAAASPSIDHIFVSGELNASNQTGSSDSVIAINGTGNKKITVTGISNATLRGSSGKRALSIAGGADLVLENLIVTGGNAGTGADGGGIRITGNSKVKFSGGSITGNSARSGGGVFVGEGSSDMSEFSLMGGSINGNTAVGTATALASLAGGGGVCVNGNATFWLGSGTVSNNTTAGSGGGVLVRGVVRGYTSADENSGFLMSGGSVSGNKSNGGASPHGGGGVYVATGEFDMSGGEITGNESTRQGGGIFVHSAAIFTGWGNASITGNKGVGSSKGICSRGSTTLRGKAQADTVYVWNPLREDAAPFTTSTQADNNRFYLAEYARVGGIVLAHSVEGRNFVDLEDIIYTGSDQIARIDLEGHLTNGKFVDTDINDWLNKRILLDDDPGNLTTNIGRFPLGTFVGGGPIYLSDSYKLEANNGEGILKRK